MIKSSTSPYNTLWSHFRERYGERVQKIPLDAGFTCPNRDGGISTKGCVFCNPSGSGTGFLQGGLSLQEQWEYWREHFIQKKPNTRLFLAYLQSYTNTYGPLTRIRKVLGDLEKLPGLFGLSLGTRPDCIDADKLDVIAAFPAKELILELGLQSSNDATLARINRGHDAACFAKACKMATQRNIKVVAHLMAGLPGEGQADFLASIDFINQLPVHGVKLHNVYVCRNTQLAVDFEHGKYQPLNLDNYAEMVARALARLRPDIIVHRLNGDPDADELLAPEWATEKQLILNLIHSTLAKESILQGCDYTSFESL